MKESIQKSSHEVSIVIYDAPLPPRYIRFSKNFIRTLFVATPLIIGIILFAFFAYGLGNRLKTTGVPNLPSIKSLDETKIQSLEQELESLKKSTALLQDKLSTDSSGATPSDGPYLMSIRRPYGMQNLVAENRISLGQLEYIQEKDKTLFNFQIISSNPETKVTGHIIVFMVSKGGLVAYPPNTNSELELGIKYSLGETFAVSRLRPTKAEFAVTPIGESVKFVVYIFSREGDLLIIKESESYKIGNKS
jgi:hypothetical protein